MFLEQAGVDMENLVPLDRVVPVTPRHITGMERNLCNTGYQS